MSTEVKECPQLVEHQWPRYRKDHTKKGPYFKPIIEKVLSDVYAFKDPIIKGKISQMTGGQAVILKLLKRAALDGDVPAIKEMLDRIDGAVKRFADVENTTQNILVINVPNKENLSDAAQKRLQEFLPQEKKVDTPQ